MIWHEGFFLILDLTDMNWKKILIEVLKFALAILGGAGGGYIAGA